jgi:hypothetical protein
MGRSPQTPQVRRSPEAFELIRFFEMSRPDSNPGPCANAGLNPTLRVAQHSRCYEKRAAGYNTEPENLDAAVGERITKADPTCPSEMSSPSLSSRNDLGNGVSCRFLRPERLQFAYNDVSCYNQNSEKALILLARPEGFEPPTLGSEVRCSIQLSHGRLSES